MPNLVYPTPLEIIRKIIACANVVIDEKAKKRLDDLVRDVHADYRESNILLKGIQQYLEGIVGVQFSVMICGKLEECLQEYKQIVATLPVDLLARSELVSLLNRHLFSNWASDFLVLCVSSCGGPPAQEYVSGESRAVESVLSWFESLPEIISWKKSVTKESRYTWKEWKRGHSLPSAVMITYLGVSGTEASMVGLVDERIIRTIQSLLLVARTFDDASKLDKTGQFNEAVRYHLSGGGCGSLASEVRSQQGLMYQKYLAPIEEVLGCIEKGLLRSKRQSCDCRESIKSSIEKANRYLEAHTPLPKPYYWLAWQEARWFVYSGDIESASVLYQSAFEESLYSAGEDVGKIIEEALALTAVLKNTNLMRWLINIWYQFELGFPLEKPISEKKPRLSDFVDNWEVEHWAARFSQLFPECVLFEGVTYDFSTIKTGPLIVVDQKRLDLKKPNRKIKIGDTWKKPIPQLVWFVSEGNYRAVEALLQKGANVNLCSDVGESALLMAIENLNLTNIGASNNEALFELLSGYPHDEKVLNLLTDKKRLSPLIAAIETGRFHIVKKVLEMGCDPNVKASTDLRSPLYKSLILLSEAKNQLTYQRIQLLCEGKLPISEVTTDELDAIRRNIPDLAGVSPEGIRSYMTCWMQNEAQREVLVAVNEHYKTNNQKVYSVDELRKIAMLLIKNGANPNDEYSRPIRGYTPLMLAAEIDEAYLFAAMIENEGDFKKTYLSDKYPRPIGILDIALNFKSFAVLSFIKELRYVGGGFVNTP